MAKRISKNEFRYGVEGWYNGVESTAFTRNIVTGDETPLNTRYASGGSRMNSIAVYATHTLEINDRLIINDGIRYSFVGLNAKFTDTTFFKFPFTAADQNNGALNGNLGVIYMPDKNTRVIAGISSGFRAPNVDDLSKVFESTPGNVIVPNDDLEPEYTYNGEVGITHIVGGRFTMSATGYYTLFRNALTVKDYTYNGLDSILYEGVMSNVVAVQIAEAQTIGVTKTENFKADFEKKKDISAYLDYEGPKKNIQILKCGIGEEVYEMYPELKEKRVGLGVANIVLEYLDNLNRFEFTEDKTEIKNRMVQQFKASNAGISENKIEGRGKIKLANYFVEIEVYDYSVSEDETINLKDGIKDNMVTRIGLQVRFTNAENGTIIAASGLGEAKTTRELTLVSDASVDPIKFNQSTISISTKKALDVACANILDKMIKKGVFEK